MPTETITAEVKFPLSLGRRLVTPGTILVNGGPLPFWLVLNNGRLVPTLGTDTGHWTIQFDYTPDPGDVAQADIEAIPQWATFTVQAADAWYTTNVREPHAAAATLAAEKAVIGTIINVLWAVIRMVIALRNKSFPGLQG